MAIKHASPVSVSLHDLQNNTVPFSTLLKAFGPDSLGILVVTDLPPSFPSLRATVLSNSSRLAALPASKLESLTNPTAKYLVGWSHGVETLRPGVVDTAKGSYYINCAFYKSPELLGADGDRFPGFEEYTAPNVWPQDDDIPGFRAAVQDLITLIIDTGVLVARACDRFAESEIDTYTPGYLENIVRTSTTTKARLLHYFPIDAATNGDAAESNGHGAETEMGAEEDKEMDDSWCATHLDHGCLTGLTSAMFLDESTATTVSAGDGTASSPLHELPSSPDPSSGLYILSRAGEIHKVAIPRGSLAFQTGEALERITRGKFKAVPHFVKGVDPKNCAPGMKIARNTLAVFTQPNLDELVDTETGLTFQEFARGVVKKNTAA